MLQLLCVQHLFALDDEYEVLAKAAEVWPSSEFTGRPIPKSHMFDSSNMYFIGLSLVGLLGILAVICYLVYWAGFGMGFRTGHHYGRTVWNLDTAWERHIKSQPPTP